MARKADGLTISDTWSLKVASSIAIAVNESGVWSHVGRGAFLSLGGCNHMQDGMKMGAFKTSTALRSVLFMFIVADGAND